jgi:ornithine carbamoyltransferase
MSLFGKSLICTQDWSVQELDLILKTAIEMKKNRDDIRWREAFLRKDFLMMFYSPSIRTHLSFVAAATDLGGHAQYLSPSTVKLKSKLSAGESIEDVAKVMSQYMSGIGIRIMEDSVSAYGEGHQLIREYDKYATIPVINMADDVCHPCQALADIMGWTEHFSKKEGEQSAKNLKGKTLLLSWAKGKLARSWNSPQGSLILASRYGMNIKLARPDGYDMDPKIYKIARENCASHGSSFDIVTDAESGYEGADVVYSRNWISSEAYAGGVFNRETEVESALSHKDWMTTETKMRKTKNAIFTHPMPVDRGSEVEDGVASGHRSVIYNVASNRLHVQKAVIAHTMGRRENLVQLNTAARELITES